MAQYTTDQLVAIVRGEGLSATPRLVRDWSELGLLDRPERHGLGRGAGSTAMWDGNQLELLRALLRQRRDNGSSIHALTNAPVGLWLYFGDEYVPLRQVRRALRTWSGPARASSVVRADAAAKEVVDNLTHPSASRRARKWLRELLRELQAGTDVPEEDLLKAARAVIDPLREGPRGPVTAPLTPEAYIQTIAAITRGFEVLDTAPAAIYEEARKLIRANLAAYAREQPAYALDPNIGHVYEPPTDQLVLNRACHDLVLALGLLAQHHERAELSTGGNRRRRTPFRHTP